LRRDPNPAQRQRLFSQNASMCCVCKAFGVGLELHHIDGDSSNTVDANLAVLCVSDHDAHHRPGRYLTRHTELDDAAIALHKRDWEAFIAEAAAEKPRLLVTVSMFGTLDALHSAKSAYQWTDGRIVFERLYHLHSGTLRNWAKDIVGEASRIGKNIPIVLVDRPQDVKHCPCCHKSLSAVIDRGYGLRLVATDWVTASSASIYINPDQPSLAVIFSLSDRSIFTASLHLCGGKYLHFSSDEYVECVSIRPRPSVRTQATRVIQKLLRDWRPAHTLVGTGDHEQPHIIDDFELPRCWEALAGGRGLYTALSK
jgi:hypothetical protein